MSAFRAIPQGGDAIKLCRLFFHFTNRKKYLILELQTKIKNTNDYPRQR